MSAHIFVSIFDGMLCPFWFCNRAANCVKVMFSYVIYYSFACCIIFLILLVMPTFWKR